MGKYSVLRKLKHLLRTKTAIVAAHHPIVARIDMMTFELAHRIAVAAGMEALLAARCGVAIIPGLDTS